MADLPASIEKKLAKLTSDFFYSLSDRFQNIERGMKAVLSKNAGPAALKDLHLHMHKLNGSSSTFGFESLSSIAAKIECLLSEIMKQESGLTNECVEKLSLLYDQLLEGRKEIDAEPVQELPQAADTPSIPARLKPNAEKERRLKELIYFCLDDLQISENLQRQFGLFGFQIKNICSIGEIRNLVAEQSQQIVLIDTEYLQTSNQIAQELAQLKREFASSINYIFLSSYNDFDTRLKAIRAGGDAFFQHPVDVGGLSEKIDEIVLKNTDDPYHILIVDDDPEQVSYHAHVLQQAGMITSVAIDPKQVVKVLVEAKPEIILMDMYMPGCSGMELAAVIRQQEAFVSIPIVFLSVEKDMDKQLAAIRLGGDDFLTKPIKEAHLIASITNRAQRTRSMRYLMERDSLTGLLNHSNLIENLNRELKRAERTDSEICFAMIDLDHFKKVNDTYGHLTGDKVLQGLARLLRERLRSTDIIGRYGGEEYAVILLNTSLGNAKKIIDQIRENFSQINQQAGEGDFHVTFSCGIAGYPDFKLPEAINEAADKALYDAKECGRNQVLLSKPE